MKKKFFNVYILIVLIIFSIILTGLLHVKYLINENGENIILLKNFSVNNEKNDFREQKVDIEENKYFKSETIISKEEFNKIDGDALLIVPRIRGTWHRIYFNDTLIGMIGDDKYSRVKLWNNVYKFVISEKLIENENSLVFYTYSEYKIGHGNIPIFISDTCVGTKIFYLLKTIYSNLYIFFLSILLAMSLVEIMLFVITKMNNKTMFLFPVSVFIISIYLLDYIVVPHPFFSALLFKKILLSLLYISAIVMSIALSKLYKSKMIMNTAKVIGICIILMLVLSKNLIDLSYYSGRLNLILLITVLSWIYVSYKNYRLYKKPEDYMIAFSGILLLGPSTFDTFSLLLFDGELMRVGAYGIVFYSIAILLIALTNYIEYQNLIYSENRIIELEKERLKHALIFDELTGLYNHTHFYETFSNRINMKNEHMDIIFIDIDKIRPINDLLGYDIGDKIIKGIADEILNVIDDKKAVYRFGGEEFIIIYNRMNFEVPSIIIADEIRKKIISNEKLQALSRYLPLTLSIGIAKYPEDSIDSKLVISKAQKAMIFAKLNGRNRVCIYNPDIESKLESDNEINYKNQVLIKFVYSLASAIDLKDTYTGFHSEEVSRFSMMIADELVLSEKQKYAIRLGGLLHDIGKLSISDTIIRKKGKLTDEEYSIIKEHPKSGSDIVSQIVDNNDIISCVRSHHERYDGKGYPDGLKGEEIPIVARITCIADAYHAMISKRSYRDEMSKEEALLELENNKGTQFDSKIVDVFINTMKDSD